MPSRPLLFSPSGHVIAAAHDPAEVKDATKDALLIEVFGIIQGVPSVISKWERVGGMTAAVQQISQMIVGVIGVEELGKRLGIEISEVVNPTAVPGPPDGAKTFDDVERQAARATFNRHAQQAMAEDAATPAPSSSGITRLRDWLKGGRR